MKKAGAENSKSWPFWGSEKHFAHLQVSKADFF